MYAFEHVRAQVKGFWTMAVFSDDDTASDTVFQHSQPNNIISSLKNKN